MARRIGRSEGADPTRFRARRLWRRAFDAVMRGSQHGSERKHLGLESRPNYPALGGRRALRLCRRQSRPQTGNTTRRARGRRPIYNCPCRDALRFSRRAVTYTAMPANDQGGMPDAKAKLIQTPLRADETVQPPKPEQPAKKSFRNVAATEAHIRDLAVLM